MSRGTSIWKMNFMGFLVIIFILTVSLGGSWIYAEYRRFESESVALEEEYIASRKTMMRREIDTIVAFINFERKQTGKRLRNQLRDRVIQACNHARSIYQENRERLTGEEIQQIIVQELKEYRFDNGQGYYFATTGDGGKEIIADEPELAGRKLINASDGSAEAVVRGMVAMVTGTEEAFFRYHAPKPGNTEVALPKLSFVKYFEPFKWHIGTGAYLDDMMRDVQFRIIERMYDLRHEPGTFMYVFRYDGTVLFHEQSQYIGRQMPGRTDVEGKDVYRALLHAGKKAGGGYVSYVWIKPETGQPVRKIAYAKAYEDWQWIVATDIYTDDFEAILQRKKAELEHQVNNYVIRIVFLFTAFIVLVINLSHYFSRRLDKEFKVFTVFFQEAATTYKEIDATLLNFTEFRKLAGSANKMIQDRKHTEKALRSSHETLETILDSLDAAVYVADMETYEILFANKHVIDIFGNVTGKICWQSIQQDRDGPCAFCTNDKLLDDDGQPAGVYVWEFRNTVDGRWYDLRDRAIQWVDNRIVRMEIATDITQRKKSEEELRRLRNLLGNIVNSMPSVLVGVDSEGKVTQWNREAEKKTGVKNEVAKGRVLSEVFPQLEGEMGKVWRAIRGQGTQKDTKVAIHTGDETWFSDVTVFPLVANGVGGAVIRVDDVTERVRIEEMMIQTEKMMSVGGLAAGMAHEINNPLAGIIQNIQVVLNRISRDLPANESAAAEYGTDMAAIRGFMKERDIWEMLEAIKTSGERAADIVRNMLSFSRKGESRHMPVDLGNLLDITVALAESDYDLKKSYDFKNIEIVREYDPALPDVPCEKTQIQQVILNLLKNAAAEMARDKKDRARTGQASRIILRTLHEGDMARIEVEDNGPGMDAATSKRVFEPFFTTKDVGKGTGLGLSVSYFIITENHGGVISVASKPGIGTVFAVKLPLYKE